MKAIYEVGGCIRDRLLGLEPKDIDYVAVGYTEKDFKHLNLVGKDFPVFLDENKNEIALARIERKNGKGYKGFTAEINNVTLEDDLKRRDLTINSMAMDKEGNLIDPYNGQEDLKNGILRHTSEAFKEDPVRVLRLARFAAKYKFEIHETTKELVLTMKEELQYLTKERVILELKKASEKELDLFFIILKDLNVLDVIFPEIFEMIGVEHNNKHHLEGDVFNHTMLVLKEIQKLTTDFSTIMGALYHDIGKVEMINTTGKMHGHDEIELIDRKILFLKENRRFDNEVLKTIETAAKGHHYIHQLLNMKEKTIAKKFGKIIPLNIEAFENFYLIAQADELGRISKEPKNINTDAKKEILKRMIIELKKVSPVALLNSKENVSKQEIENFKHLERIKIIKIFIKELKDEKTNNKN